jgi:predicted kinase
MPTLYTMCGLPFSGKPTLANEIAFATESKIVSFDEFWIEKNKEKSIPQGAEGWKLIRNLTLSEIEKLLIDGVSVVYDDTNARVEHRQELREISKKTGARQIVIYLSTPIEFIRKRETRNIVTKEKRQVELKKFQAVFNQFEIPNEEENVVEFKPGMDINQWIKNLKTRSFS